MLSISGLRVAYGGIQAIKGVDLEIYPGELVTLIGANGAGKTSTLKAVTGTLSSAEMTGDVTFLGSSLRDVPSHQLAQRGLAMVPEGRGVLTRMSVHENLLMGAYRRKDAEVGADIAHWFEIFPRLRERVGQLAGTLSGGEQQMLALARAMMCRPKLLLLDEPSMGLSPVMVQKIFAVISSLLAQGVTILLVEQNARLALETAHRGYVLESGVMTLSGPATTLLNDPKVKAAYLGE